MANRCYVLGGRTSDSTLVKDKEFVACFDVASSQWVPIAGIRGLAPRPRSSHRYDGYRALFLQC